MYVFSHYNKSTLRLMGAFMVGSTPLAKCRFVRFVVCAARNDSRRLGRGFLPSSLLARSSQLPEVEAGVGGASQFHTPGSPLNE